MRAEISYLDSTYSIDFDKPIDISIPVGNVKCFHATDYKASPYVSGDFVGSVAQGSAVNFFNIQMNPHGNGTHTECLGHITEAHESITDYLKNHHFIAQLISIAPVKIDGDKIITLRAFKRKLDIPFTKALIIRTLPNDAEKLDKDYSGSNPPYFEEALIDFLVEHGVEHLLVDLPSVDREEDGGLLFCHKAFWKIHDIRDTSESDRKHCTITELIYVPDEVEDGLYLLNLQTPTIKLDAVPSKPVIYTLNHEE